MSMGIALPKWVVESQNNMYVLGVYGLLFGICLPYFVVRNGIRFSVQLYVLRLVRRVAGGTARDGSPKIKS
jgi:preprotein translocase subunit Sec63